MFALLAAVCFFLVMVGLHNLGKVDLVILGFFFIALELLFSWHPWDYFHPRPPQ